ncbi:MAG: DUF935 family protein [Gammaproteobacteria bacterium]|nr:DUF935 family protein [Gammaproteobacteria bacterium]
MGDSEKPNARPAPEEASEALATVRGGRDITRGYIEGLPYLPPQDKVLRHRGATNYELYEDLLQDDRVMSALAQRRLALSSLPVRVEPGGDSPADALAAEFVDEQIQGLRWKTVVDRMHYGVFYGYSVAELLYGQSGGLVRIDRIRVRNRRRFVFDADFRPKLLTNSAWEGEELPEWKFWTFSTGADHDDEPYGKGLAHWCFWPSFFKKHQVKFWLTALEKFGSPTVIGKYRRGAAESERDALLNAIDDVRIRTGIAVPDDTLIELLEAARSGSMDYAAFREAMDESITMIVLSQTMTSQDGSSLSQAQVHKAVRDEVVASDGRLICDSFSRGPAAWLTAWNFPGAATPRVEIEMPEDPRLGEKSERDLRIVRMGWNLSADYIESTYGVETDGPARPPPANPGSPPVPLAETDDPLLAALDAIDAEDWRRIASPLVRPILDRAKSDPEDLMGDIAGLYPELDADAIAEQLARILFVADTWERLAGQREEEDA